MNKLSRKDIILIVLALLVIAWAAYFYVQNRGNIFGGDKYETSKVEGKIITGFPDEFIFESGVTTVESTRTMSNSQNLWSSLYISTKTSEDIFSIYENALDFMGWEITNSSPGIRIFAKKDAMQISVGIEDKSSRREVSLSILER